MEAAAQREAEAGIAKDVAPGRVRTCLRVTHALLPPLHSLKVRWQLMSSASIAKHENTATVVSTVLPDGRLVELVYAPDEKRTQLAVGRGDEVAFEDSLTLPGGERLIPLPAANNLIRHRAVLLPEGVEVFESPESLAREITAYFDRYLDLSPGFRAIASWYVMLSWVYDAFNELPYLRLRGDFGTGKTRALTVIGSLCYKPFFASGASTVSPIFHVLDRFRGTLILDEADFRFSDEKSEIVKILNNGNMKGFPVLRTMMNANREFDPRAFAVFGPKILAMRQSFEDEALESRCITEEMGTRPMRDGIPINLPEEQASDAQLLRNKLLAYRFRFRDQVEIDSALVDPKQSARTNQLLVPLLSIIANEEAKRAALAYVADLDEEIRFDRSLRPEAVVLKVIRTLAERDSSAAILVADITKLIIEKHAREFDRFVTPRYVGEIIRKRLRLTTYKSHGVYVVPLSEREKISYLAERYGMARD